MTETSPPLTAARGRFAPSPTGAMHLGNARTALIAWLDARSRDGGFVLRIEDLDRARVAAGAERRLLDELAWLGLDWDEGGGKPGPYAPYRQSERTRLYDEAVDRLLASGRAYLCACSRADIARAPSAPHADELLGPRYPGTCRGRAEGEIRDRARQAGRAPAVRFDGRSERIDFIDLVRGPVPAEPDGIDDFVLRRADGVASYQLAVVVDDAAMAIARVVRGDDLLSSTPRQLALYRALGLAPPSFAHLPLLLSPEGDRLAKRNRPPSVAGLRERGLTAQQVVGALAASAGLLPDDRPVTAPAELVGQFSLGRLRRVPAVLTL